MPARDALMSLCACAGHGIHMPTSSALQCDTHGAAGAARGGRVARFTCNGIRCSNSSKLHFLTPYHRIPSPRPPPPQPFPPLPLSRLQGCRLTVLPLPRTCTRNARKEGSGSAGPVAPTEDGRQGELEECGVEGQEQPMEGHSMEGADDRGVAASMRALALGVEVS